MRKWRGGKMYERDKRLQRSLKNHSRLRIDGNSFVIASGLSRSIYVEFPAWLSRGKSVSFVRLNEIRGDPEDGKAAFRTARIIGHRTVHVDSPIVY